MFWKGNVPLTKRNKINIFIIIGIATIIGKALRLIKIYLSELHIVTIFILGLVLFK